MNYILKAIHLKRWVQKHDPELGMTLLTSKLDDAQMFGSRELATQAMIEMGRSDLEINGHIYYEDLP